jgi:catechol 2,3-dioxygenase-like lactoylglutathione lyase family enzyme
MAEYVQSLGWFIRFVPPAETALNAFYRDALGFPFIRAGNAQAVDFLWAGEALVFELIYEGRMSAMPASESDPDTVPLLPMYRVHDLEDLTQALRAKGIPVTDIRDSPFGRESFLTDPLGGLVGMRQVEDRSGFSHDVEARRRAARGEAFNPGCAPMPAGWQELGWLVRHVANVPRMQQFYTEVLGLPLAMEREGHALLDLGDNSLLELAPGGQARRPPADRAELPATFILRIQSIIAFRQEMLRRGVHIVHDVNQWARGSLSYIADPEGNLIGVEEKYHPSHYAGSAPFPEDLEAQRRWHERLAIRRAGVA